ncbi:MAG: DUF6807 family protein [Pirellulaceae bacterium]
MHLSTRGVVFALGVFLLGTSRPRAADDAVPPSATKPDATPAPSGLDLQESEATLTVTSSGRPVLVYNKQPPPVPDGIAAAYARSGFLHPVFSPGGSVVTATYPFDHPHQHGVFSAWVKTTYDGRPVDFWNLAGGTGRVFHERVVSRFTRRDAAGFEVDLLHRSEAQPPIDILRERWKVTVLDTGSSHRCFDLETVQSALTDSPLVISQYHYGGIALRGPVRWLAENDSDARRRPDSPREPSRIVNSLGSDRIQGNHQHTRWVALTGTIDQKPATIAVLVHPQNFRAPQAARLHPSKPYFVFSPCVDGEFRIDREHPFQSRYRFLVTDVPPDAAWIDEQWRTWCEP